MITGAMGVMVFLVGMALAGSIAVNLHTHYLLKQCREILYFCMGLAEDEEAMKREGTE